MAYNACDFQREVTKPFGESFTLLWIRNSTNCPLIPIIGLIFPSQSWKINAFLQGAVMIMFTESPSIDL